MSDLSNDEIISGLDMVIPAKDAQKKVFMRVDNAISAAKEFKNMQPIWNAVMGMSEFSKATGLGLAKLLYEGYQVWQDLGLGTEAHYCDEAYINAGKHKQTIKRYMGIWTMFAENYVPGDYVDGIMSLGVKCIVPIAQLVKEGREIPSEKWLAFSNAADEAEVRKIKKEITKKKDNPNSLKLFIDRDGDINAITGKGRNIFIGHLRVSEIEKDADLKRAIERIINSSGLIEK